MYNQTCLCCMYKLSKGVGAFNQYHRPFKFQVLRLVFLYCLFLELCRSKVVSKCIPAKIVLHHFCWCIQYVKGVSIHKCFVEVNICNIQIMLVSTFFVSNRLICWFLAVAWSVRSVQWLAMYVIPYFIPVKMHYKSTKKKIQECLIGALECLSFNQGYCMAPTL